MPNILFNFKLHRLKHFLVTGRGSFYATSRCLSSSLPERRIASSGNFARPNSFHASARCICTSVIRLDKPSDARCDEGGKSGNSIIYNGALSYQVKGVKMFTCITSFGGILIQPLLVQNILDGNNMPLGVAVFCCVGFFTFLTPFFIHLITKKYVTEIWYNAATDTYTATVLSFFLRKIHITFKIEDVTIPSMLPIFSTMNIKGRPLFIISDSFLEMKHYIKMMGYDKPMDMKLSAAPESIQRSQSKAKSEIL